MKLGRFMLLLGCLALCFAGGLMAFNFVVMPQLIHHNDVVTVPDVRERTVAEARAALGRAGLHLQEERQAPHPTIPAGQIIKQTPRAAAPIRTGRRVIVVVSSGPALSSAPELAGLSRRQAEMTLQNLSLRPGRLLRLRREGMLATTVVYQYPPAGTSLLRDAAVDMVVADPALPPAYLMPDLRGATLDQARAVIVAAGCVTGGVTFQRQRGMPANIVLAQEPAPGSRVLKGATIDLVAAGR